MRIQKKNKAKLNNAGMTLVEILVAMTILAVAVVPLLFAFVNSFRYSIRGREVQQTTVLAQTIIENCKAYSTDTVRTQLGTDDAFLHGLKAANVYDAGNIFYMQDVPLDNQLYDVTLELTPRGINSSSNTSYDIMNSLSMNPYLDAVFTPTGATYTDSTTGVTWTAAELDSAVYLTALQRIASGIEAETEAELGAGNGVLLSTSYIEDSFNKSTNPDYVNNQDNFKLHRKTQIYILNTDDEVDVIITYSFDLDGGKYYYKGVDASGNPKTYEWGIAGNTIGTYTFKIYSNVGTNDVTHPTKLENIYFFYYPLYNSSLAMYPYVTDEFEVINHLTDTSRQINLYMIKQKNTAYSDMDLRIMEASYATKITGSGNPGTIKVYHNYLDNLGTDIIGGVSVTKQDGSVEKVQDGLTENLGWFLGVESKGSMYIEDDKTLIYDLLVTIYDAGAYDDTTKTIIAGSEPVLMMDGTDLDW